MYYHHLGGILYLYQIVIVEGWERCNKGSQPHSYWGHCCPWCMGLISHRLYIKYDVYKEWSTFKSRLKVLMFFLWTMNIHHYPLLTSLFWEMQPFLFLLFSVKLDWDVFVIMSINVFVECKYKTISSSKCHSQTGIYMSRVCFCKPNLILKELYPKTFFYPLRVCSFVHMLCCVLKYSLCLHLPPFPPNSVIWITVKT